MALTLEERETHINIPRIGDTIQIYASDERYMRKFDKLVEQNPDAWKCVETETMKGEVIGKRYECPVGLITFRAKKKTLTEEQCRELGERLRNARN